MERTEIDELIDQAKAILKKWRKPTNEPRLSHRTMQQLLDDRKAPSGM